MNVVERQARGLAARVTQGRSRLAALRREVRRTVELAGFSVEDIFPDAGRLPSGNQACIEKLTGKPLDGVENGDLDAYYQAVLDEAELGADRQTIERRRRGRVIR